MSGGQKGRTGRDGKTLVEGEEMVEESGDTVETEEVVVPIGLKEGAPDAATEEFLVAEAAIKGLKEVALEAAGAATVYLGEVTDAVIGGEEEVEAETANSGAEWIIFSLFIFAWCSAARTRSRSLRTDPLWRRGERSG